MSIRVEGLSCTYLAGTPLAVRALADVSLQIPDGDFVALIGPTGSGKSTLIQHFNGLLRPRPGTVWVDGLDVGDRRTDVKEVRRRVGLVFQYPEHQLFEETVYQDVAFGPRCMGLPPHEVDRRVKRALRLVGLDPEAFGARSPFQLSGGQRRRAALAGVLALQTPTLVLDEPGAGLDPAGRRALAGLLRRLNRSGTTVVLVTHDMEEVAQLARRVLVMNGGRLVADLPVRELFTRHRELLERCSLGLPAAAELVQRLKALGAPLAGQAITPEEAVAEIAAWKLGRRAAAAGPRPERGAAGVRGASRGAVHPR